MHAQCVHAADSSFAGRFEDDDALGSDAGWGLTWGPEGRGVKCLSPSAQGSHRMWTDMVVNYAMSRLHREFGGAIICRDAFMDGARNLPGLYTGHPGRVCFCGSFFYSKAAALVKEKNTSTHDGWRCDLTRDISKVNYLSDIDRVIMPVHIPGGPGHWLLATLDFPQGDTPGSIDLYDSSHNTERLERVGATLRGVLRGINTTSHSKIPGAAKDRFDPSRWRTTIHPPEIVPQQQNGYDCGVFMFVFAAARASGTQPGPGSGLGVAPEWVFSGDEQARQLNAWLLQSMYLDSVADNSCPPHGYNLCSVA